MLVSAPCWSSGHQGDPAPEINQQGAGLLHQHGFNPMSYSEGPEKLTIFKITGHLLYEESVTDVPRISVTYVLRIFCNLCPRTVHFLPIVTSPATYSNRQPSDLREHRVRPLLRSLDTFRCRVGPSQREVRSFVLLLAIRMHARLRHPLKQDRA